MKRISKVVGKAIPLAMDDVDTDLIIPAQYLTSVSKTGYGKNLFQRLRNTHPEFVFNQAKFAGANILITKANFGCGSSREHAVWALQEAGIEAVIAISFSDIFSGNSTKNGLLLIQLPPAVIHDMLEDAATGDYVVAIDIEQQEIHLDHFKTCDFEMDPFRKYCFSNGLDDLDYLLSYQQHIESYEHKRGNMS